MANGTRLEDLPLWQATFETAQDGETPDQRRARLRFQSALLQMREHVGHLVASIAADMPGLTVHDLTHLDALWEMAGIAFGDAPQLNPAEGFVLGGAILLHDAALTLAAYPGRMDALRAMPEWGDLAVRERRQLGLDEGQVLSNGAQARIAWQLLRRLHAERAAKLPAETWRYRGQDHRLMDDSQLRDHFGHTIGQIAASHHLRTDQLRHLHNDLGALPGTPWIVRTLLTASLLRVADAMHLDSRRAPPFLAALQQPTGVSALHWVYQARLAPVYLQGDQLKLTSTGPFPVADAQAWWLALDWARMIDGELRDVDRLLSEQGQGHRPLPRLLARSVHGVGDPLSFAGDVSVEGWEPVDATVKVSDVPALARRLGGEALYGDRPDVVLRELVQNACDAVVARRLLEDGFKGSIKARLEDIDDESWLVVEDDGCGMSAATLTGRLLDFGKSFWQTGDVTDEFPGLLGKGFVPEGRFGIGFFSVFMLGERVEVTSRRYDAGHKEARCLVFEQGAGARPILAVPDKSSGSFVTRVKVCLRSNKRSALERAFKSVARLFPAMGVDFSTSVDGHSLQMAANDWLTIGDAELFERAGASIDATEYPTSLIEHEGRIYGRAAVLHDGASNQACAVVDSRGLMIDDLGAYAWCTGVLRGTATTAARQQAEVQIPPEALAQWATRQAQALLGIKLSMSYAIHAAAQVLLAGGDVGKLPYLAGKWKVLSDEEVRLGLQATREVYLYFDNFFHSEVDPVLDEIEWSEWCQDKTVWRAAAIFSSADEALADLSGLCNEADGTNPVLQQLMRSAAEAWGTPVSTSSETKDFFPLERSLSRRLVRRRLIRIAPAGGSEP